MSKYATVKLLLNGGMKKEESEARAEMNSAALSGVDWVVKELGLVREGRQGCASTLTSYRVYSSVTSVPPAIKQQARPRNVCGAYHNLSLIRVRDKRLSSPINCRDLQEELCKRVTSSLGARPALQKWKRGGVVSPRMDL